LNNAGFRGFDKYSIGTKQNSFREKSLSNPPALIIVCAEPYSSDVAMARSPNRKKGISIRRSSVDCTDFFFNFYNLVQELSVRLLLIRLAHLAA